MTRSGFVAVAGRPNVGKSTLVNALVGARVAVAVHKPQTTRRAIRGVVSGGVEGESWQRVLVDLPGVQRPLDALTERMQSRVEKELGDCDAVLFVLNAAERIGAGDRFIASALGSSSAPVIAAVNKVDVLDRGRTAAALEAAAGPGEVGSGLREIFPVSARPGDGIRSRARAPVELLPPGPLYYPDEVHTDEPRETALAELIREQALSRTREEIPHALEVKVEEIEERPPLTDVRAVIWVEKESQKGILIGKGGKMIRAIGTAARGEIERYLGQQVYLDLTVKVRSAWRDQESLLNRLGIE